MSEPVERQAAATDPVVSDEALKEAEKFIEEGEGATNRLSGGSALSSR